MENTVDHEATVLNFTRKNRKKNYIMSNQTHNPEKLQHTRFV